MLRKGAPFLKHLHQKMPTLGMKITNVIFIVKRTGFNPLPTTCDAVRKKTKIFQRIFSVQYCHNLKKYQPSGKLKFSNLGIFQSLKLRILMEKIFLISLKLNFAPNTLGCHGFSR